MPYQVVGKAHHRGDVHYEPGEPIDPTPEELSAFPHRFEEIPARRGRPPKVATDVDLEESQTEALEEES